MKQLSFDFDALDFSELDDAYLDYLLFENLTSEQCSFNDWVHFWKQSLTKAHQILVGFMVDFTTTTTTQGKQKMRHTKDNQFDPSDELRRERYKNVNFTELTIWAKKQIPEHLDSWTLIENSWQNCCDVPVEEIENCFRATVEMFIDQDCVTFQDFKTMKIITEVLPAIIIGSALFALYKYFEVALYLIG